MGNLPPENNETGQDSGFRRVRNVVVLPNGTKREPMGSGLITGILGVGGMANVYEIWNPQLEISRAVKLLHPNYTEEIKQRFQTEIKITAKLHHPNIIEIHGVGEWNGLPYIEMERINGKTLETIIKERGALPVEVCTSIGIMMGRALRYAHNEEYVIYGKKYHGIIHRDLKPSNIMVNSNGIVKLMDFGIARPTDASIHTTDGAILGTMQYLSPEQLEGKDLDIRTDIYSLGTIMYEMITGIKAFPESNVSKLMLSIIKNEFRTLDRFELQIPPRFRRLVHKCMVHDYEKRIQDATSFLSELTRIHKSITTLSPEQVMRKFLSEQDFKRTVLKIRNKLPITLVTAISLTTIIFGITTYLILKNIDHSQKKAAVVTLIKPSVIPVSDSPDVAQKKVTEKIKKESIKLSSGKSGKKAVKNTVLTSETVSPGKEPVNNEESFIEGLKSKYGSADLLTIFTKEVQGGRYDDALKIYNHLSNQDASSDKAVLFRIRMLKQLHMNSDFKALLLSKDVKDGEFFLEKAKLYIDQGNLGEANRYLDLSSKTPGSYIEGSILHLERIYQTARCKSREFDADPSKKTGNTALDSWFEVKSELQTAKDHKYFKEADSEMQRITQKMNSGEN
jgi:serine/threonine protein kinase